MNDWTTGPATAKPLSALAKSALDHYKTEDALMQAWQDAAQALTLAKDLEQRLRLVLFEIKFRNPVEGTNRVELGNGFSLKAQYPFTYRVSNKEAKAEQAQDAMAEISQQAGFIADRLFKWEPDLVIKEYRLLNADNPAAQTDEQKKILAILAPILTVTPGMPQLELEKPKGRI